MGAAAGASSLVGMGLTAYSAVLKGEGQNSADTYKAETLENAANVEKVKAVQTGAVMSENLATTLGNLSALNAAKGGSPLSPTAAAVRNSTENIGLAQKTVAVDNIVQQSRQDEADAAYMRSAGKYALLSGDLSAGASIAQGLGSVLGSTPGGAGTPNVGSMLATSAGF
jgi:hypothetical protein